MALTVKKAIRARSNLLELAPEIVVSAREDIRLEEIERAGDFDWAITFRISGRPSLDGFSSNPFGFAKVVDVDGSDGKFVALKQRAA